MCASFDNVLYSLVLFVRQVDTSNTYTHTENQDVGDALSYYGTILDRGSHQLFHRQLLATCAQLRLYFNISDFNPRHYFLHFNFPCNIKIQRCIQFLSLCFSTQLK